MQCPECLCQLIGNCGCGGFRVSRELAGIRPTSLAGDPLQSLPVSPDPLVPRRSAVVGAQVLLTADAMAAYLAHCCGACAREGLCLINTARKPRWPAVGGPNARERVPTVLRGEDLLLRFYRLPEGGPPGMSAELGPGVAG